LGNGASLNRLEESIKKSSWYNIKDCSSLACYRRWFKLSKNFKAFI